MTADWDFLNYKNRWQRILESEMTGSDECASDPIIFDPPEAPQTVIYQWDLATFTKVLSCVVKGAFLSYPDNYIQVTWEFLKGVDCPVSICELIIDCIENDADVQAALGAFIQQQIGNAQGYPLSAKSNSEALNQGAETCDKNSLWGSCLYTIQTLNRLNLDFFETMEALTDNQEMLAFFVGAIPVLETLPIDEAIEIADKIREFVNDTYLAGYDVDLEQAMACDLFCLSVLNDCQLTAELIFDYFKSRALAIEGFEDVWTSALTIIHAMANWEEAVGEKVVLAMMACNIGFMTFLNSALGMDFGHFKALARAGIPDDDWITLCTSCEWDATFPTNAAWDLWTFNDYFGAIPEVVGTKLEGNNTTNGSGQLSLYIQTTIDTVVTKIEIDIEWQNDGLNPPPQLAVLYDGGTVLATQDIQSPTSGTATFSWEGLLSGSHTFYILASLFGDTANGDYVNLTEMRWFGTGDNPFD